MAAIKNFDHLYDSPLPLGLQAAVDEYVRWNARYLAAEQAQSTITAPLYQYTGWNGLCGIIESQSVWFTDYRHLNDPSELSHGVEVAQEVLAALAERSDRRVGLFLETIRDLLVPNVGVPTRRWQDFLSPVLTCSHKCDQFGRRPPDFPVTASV